MNLQYMYLFLLCVKFKLVSFDVEACRLDRFPVISYILLVPNDRSVGADTIEWLPGWHPLIGL
jgi:hypothetical protein